MNIEFWKGRKVFLTGHTGFKGSWLSLMLQELGAELTGFALNPATTPNLFEIAGVERGMESIIGDVRDIHALKEAMMMTQPEVVIHMAAQPLVVYSYENPVETYSTNVMGTVNLLECVRFCSSVKSVVNVTTDKCYENKEWIWPYREDEALGGFDPYSNSKACSEMITASFRSSFFNEKKYEEHRVGIATARAGNVIGGGDWAANRLVPDILEAIDKNITLKLRSPDAIRPWQHVLEPLRGYLILAEHLMKDGVSFSGAWNFGPREADAETVSWIVNKLSEEINKRINIQYLSNNQLHEANILKLDTTKSNKYLGWKPIIKLSMALQMTVNWHEAYKNNHKMLDFTLMQIKEYLKIDK